MQIIDYLRGHDCITINDAVELVGHDIYCNATVQNGQAKSYYQN